MTNEISKAQEEEMSSALIAKILAEDAMVQGNDDYYTEYSNQHRYHEEDDDYEDNSGDDFNPKKLDKYRKKEVKKGRKRKAFEKPVKEPTTKKSDKLEKKTEDGEEEEGKKKEEKAVKKAKKPLPEGFNSGVYSEEEEKNFLYGLETYGRDWTKLQELIKTRDGNSIRSHAQKHFIKMFRDNIPLPAKVKESGEGYTLSGKPLDPNSSAAKPYLSRGNASKTPSQTKQETSSSVSVSKEKEEVVDKKKEEMMVTTDEKKEESTTTTTTTTTIKDVSPKIDHNDNKDKQTNMTTTTDITMHTANTTPTVNTTPNTNDESTNTKEAPKEEPAITESTSITITTTDTNGDTTTTEQSNTSQTRTPMDIDQVQGTTPMDIDQKELTPEQQQKPEEKKTKKIKSGSATPSPSSSTGTNEGKLYDSNGRTTYSTSRLRTQRAQGSINYGQITKDDDPLTLVKCEPFIGKPGSTTAGSQPFELIVDSNVLLAMDFHAHLMTTEVIGFLAGEWNKETMHMHIREVYPCRSLNTGQNDVNVEMDPTSAIEKRQLIEERNLQVVGWYHSHPTFVPDPSLVDIENQRNYQLLCRDHHDTIPTVLEPFVGAIVGPYDQALPASASVINWFHVSGADRSIPKRLYYELKENENLTQNEIDRMFELLHEYKTSSEKIVFADYWRQDESKLQKMIKSLGARMPWIQKQLKEGQTVQDSFLEKVQSNLKDW